MSLKPDLSKKAQEIVFCQKLHNISHPKVKFNNSPVLQSTYQKHLQLYLDEKLKSGSDLSKKCFIGFNESPLKMMKNVFWMHNFSWTWSYEITLVCLSVCPSVHLSIPPSLDIPKIGSLVFSGIVNDDSWLWCIVADEARYFLKKLATQIWTQGA